MMYLNPAEIGSAEDTSVFLRQCAIVARANSITKEELVCFHTKLSYTADVLGVGITLEYYPDSQGRNKPDKLAYASTTLDLLSHTAFHSLNIRRNVWKKPFTHWLPLYLNPEHGETVAFRQAIKGALAAVCSDDGRTFSPDMALTLFLKLMNTMVSVLQPHWRGAKPSWAYPGSPA